MLSKGKILQLAVGVLEVNVKTDVEIVLEISNDDINLTLFDNKFVNNINPNLLFSLSVSKDWQLDELLKIIEGEFDAQELRDLYKQAHKATEFELSRTIIEHFNGSFNGFVYTFFSDEEITKDILVAFIIFRQITGGTGDVKL